MVTNVSAISAIMTISTETRQRTADVKLTKPKFALNMMEVIMMNRMPLIELSERLGFKNDPDGMKIEIGDLVLMRSDETLWVPCVFVGFDPRLNLFRSGEGWYSMVAPVLGNEVRILTKDDCIGLIDLEWMRNNYNK
jgi:hypothetical protein